jgi:hypothetical protein
MWGIFVIESPLRRWKPCQDLFRARCSAVAGITRARSGDEIGLERLEEFYGLIEIQDVT